RDPAQAACQDRRLNRVRRNLRCASPRSSHPASPVHVMLRRTHRREAKARGQRVTDLENGQPCPACAARGCTLSGATDACPASKAAIEGHPALGQHCCPNAPCQILPRRTRLVHARTRESFPFVATTLVSQARTGPRSRPPRNGIARRSLWLAPASAKNAQGR